MAKANMEQGETLHKLITEVLIERLSSEEEILRGDIDSAIKWLQVNGVTAFVEGKEISEVTEQLRALPSLDSPDKWDDAETA